MSRAKTTTNWEVGPESREGSWITIENESFVTVCPTTDTLPHELYSMTCPCNPRVEMANKEEHYDKPFIIHNRYEDLDRIEKSLKTIYD